ncbi:hypothetical protein CpipJ_CPIJ018432 [Culex quinquefasciatus]|uniref:Uncharacterized protein n=1 Tax=Culex quinquefasciatus TaxID=7176 RepID=B0XG31_CULQU|nr:hypothetical protein CpipJ_CPIJ018432 [Culex quinquefasciatus]|eukprot:XP_001868603.1 hypothetical protein CpipJ_CPIJ018432 [Culex quinquefasciatus]
MRLWKAEEVCDVNKCVGMSVKNFLGHLTDIASWLRTITT